MFSVDPGGDRRVSAWESGVSGVHWDLGYFEMVAPSLEFLSSVKLRLPPLEGRQECQDYFPMKQGNGPSSRDEDGKPGLFWSCAVPSLFLSSGDGYVGELLELPQWCQGPF